MKQIDVFGGIGGFLLAASQVYGARHSPLLCCEIDRYCQQVLRRHWPDMLIHDDIHTLSTIEYRGIVDLLTGGFPCQPYSIAGKRRGSEDDRALWSQMLRVIRECEPRVVVGENVSGLLTQQRGMALGGMLADLEDAGYEVAPPMVLPACSVNAPHRRYRVWIVAFRHSSSRSTGGESAGRQARADTNWSSEGAAVANGTRYGFRQPDTEPSQRQTSKLGDRHCTGDLANATLSEREQSRSTWARRAGFADDSSGDTWKSNTRINGRRVPEPRFCRVADGFPDRLDIDLTIDRWPLTQKMPNRAKRIRALGNAIVPQVAVQVLRAVEHALQVEGTP